MFIRGDQLRISDMEDKFRLHAIEFGWEEFDPELYIFNLDENHLLPFHFDNRLELSVSKRRVCVGSFVNGEYVPCLRSEPVKRFSQCPECGEELIPIQSCLFEPQCEGELCDSPICRREHAIYISFFGTKPKVGMTLKSRVKRRLIEQGADAYFLVDTSENRKKAREKEKRISQKLKITERPATSAILSSLQLPKKRQQIESLWRALSEQLEQAMSMRPGNLNFLEDYPLEEPLKRVPKLADSWGMHSGKIVGIKGKFLLYDSDSLNALNLADLPSRFLSLDRP